MSRTRCRSRSDEFLQEQHDSTSNRPRENDVEADPLPALPPITAETMPPVCVRRLSAALLMQAHRDVNGNDAGEALKAWCWLTGSTDEPPAITARMCFDVVGMNYDQWVETKGNDLVYSIAAKIK